MSLLHRLTKQLYVGMSETSLRVDDYNQTGAGYIEAIHAAIHVLHDEQTVVRAVLLVLGMRGIEEGRVNKRVDAA